LAHSQVRLEYESCHTYRLDCESCHLKDRATSHIYKPRIWVMSHIYLCSPKCPSLARLQVRVHRCA